MTPQANGKKIVSIKQVLFLLAVIAAAVLMMVLMPDRRTAFLDASKKFFLEMVFVLPAIVVLLGLFAVFVPKEFITRYLGKTSGVKGFVLALGLGALPTGPLYIAFPMASALLSKGARRANIIVFLTAWACIKLPQELMELSFMGPAFTAARLALTIIAAAAMGFITERVMDGKGA